jgi:beta propeller repeat protein
MKKLIIGIALLMMLTFSGCYAGSSQVASPSSTSPSPTWIPPTPIINQEEAIAIAYQNVPFSVVEQASLSVRWTPQIGPRGAWQMEFGEANITQEELGWIPAPSGTPEVLINDFFDTGIYKTLLINIDGQTGEIMLKMATNGPRLGGPGLPPPPLTVIPPKSPTLSSPDITAPPGSWEVGENLQYSQECVWEDTLVGLELYQANSESLDGLLVPRQNIVVYDLNTRERKQVIKPPEGRMMDTPSIFGNKIVFAAVERDDFLRMGLSSKFDPSPNYDVFLYDLETNRMQQLTTEEHGQRSPRIYGATVVWLDARNQPLTQYPPPFDVYALDLKTNQETRITASATAEGYNQISISGNLVVWADMRHADISITNHSSNDPKYDNEIYLYDLATNREHRLTNSPRNDQCADIDGTRIIWLRQEDYQKADVYMYDLTSRQETQVSHSGYAAFSPSIYGDRIVWTDASSSKGNTDNDSIGNGQSPGSTIVLYDLNMQKETQLTPAEAWKVWFLPVIHQEHVVFTWSRQRGGVVYALDLPE